MAKKPAKKQRLIVLLAVGALFAGAVLAMPAWIDPVKVKTAAPTSSQEH